MKIQIADTIYSITEACPSEIPNFDYLRSQLIEHGKALQATLRQLVLLEDSDFHAFQIVDAGFKQFQTRQGTEDGRHVMIGLSRFLAAHSPTPRASAQTYQIALRLQRGEEIFSDSQTV